jgi:hypothetical protein
MFDGAESMKDGMKSSPLIRDSRELTTGMGCC